MDVTVVEIVSDWLPAFIMLAAIDFESYRFGDTFVD
jgi:hypothetical protein|tara:strand:- start:553 stop:660 length:108 start_codon:yes stop_codon:yes gene_type:complete